MSSAPNPRPATRSATAVAAVSIRIRVTLPDSANSVQTASPDTGGQVAVENYHVVVIDGRSLQRRGPVVDDVHRQGMMAQSGCDRVGQ